MRAPLSSSRSLARRLLPFAALLAVAAMPPAHSAPYVFSTLAGAVSIGSSDGPGNVARFYAPRALTVDRAGNVYVADTVNDTIRKITPDGIVSTLAGVPGMITANAMQFPDFKSADGIGSGALFFNPEGITVDPAGNVYVADKLDFTIRKITPAGVVTTIAGKNREWGSNDGPAGDARLYALGQLTIDAAGNIYFAEWGNCTVRKLTPDGTVSTVAGLAGVMGSADGTGSEARFGYPTGVAVDPAGNLFVTDSVNSTIRKITPAGVVTTFAGTAGFFPYNGADGTGKDARFYSPLGIAIDAAGNLYVADGGNYTIRKITSAGVVTTLAGAVGEQGSADGTGGAARFRGPAGVAVDTAGFVYVSDGADNTIRKISPAGVVTTLAGLGLDNSLGSADGTGSAARFNVLGSTAIGPQGELYAADPLNATIRKISPAGVVSTVAGLAGTKGSVDGTGSAARFYIPSSVTVDATGTLYVADSGNNTIRKITSAGVVSTLAGTAAVYGAADGTGPAAQFFYPYAMAADAAGTLYVTEIGNYTVRKITATGVVSTLAGAALQPGNADGPGSVARFRSPESIAVDAAGNVYVSDAGNSSIRKITPDGTVSTLPLGTYAAGTLTVNAAGDLFIADTTLRKVSAAGEVSTLAGLGSASGNADGLGADVRFNDPQGITLDTAGNVYLTSDSTIRKGQLAGPPAITQQPQNQAVTAGNSVQLSVTANGAPAPTYQWYFNGSPFSGATASTLSFANARSSDAGDYTVVVTNALGNVTSAKATLTVSAAPVTPTPTPAPASSGSGGGGSIESWFVMLLLAFSCAQRLAAKKW